MREGWGGTGVEASLGFLFPPNTTYLGTLSTIPPLPPRHRAARAPCPFRHSGDKACRAGAVAAGSGGVKTGISLYTECFVTFR